MWSKNITIKVVFLISLRHTSGTTLLYWLYACMHACMLCVCTAIIISPDSFNACNEGTAPHTAAAAVALAGHVAGFVVLLKWSEKQNWLSILNTMYNVRANPFDSAKKGIKNENVRRQNCDFWWFLRLQLEFIPIYSMVQTSLNASLVWSRHMSIMLWLAEWPVDSRKYTTNNLQLSKVLSVSEAVVWLGNEEIGKRRGEKYIK